MLAETQAFVTGDRPMVEPDRVLATVLFTDIVDSTEPGAGLGDTRWRDLLATHDRLARSASSAIAARGEEHRRRAARDLRWPCPRGPGGSVDEV